MKQSVTFRMITTLVFVLLLGFSAHAQSNSPRDLVAAEDLTIKSVQSFFDAAFLETGYDKDGDLYIKQDGISTFVKVNSDKKMLTFFSIWPLKSSVPETQKLQLVNRLNDSLILVRFCMPNSTSLWCD